MPSLFYEQLKWSASPYINRFLQPDTIIPSPASPQSWNRYSYVLNNPINASDPSGHKCVGEPEECLNEKGKPINGAGRLSVGTSGGSNGSLEDDLKTDDSDDDDDDGFEITLLDSQTSATALLDLFGWTPSGLLKFAKVMDVIALAVDSALLIGVYTVAITAAIVGGVAGAAAGPEGILAGAVAGAIKGWKTGEALASPFLVIGNSLATAATTAGFLADEATGNTSIHLTVGLNQSGIDIDGGIKVPGSTGASVVYTAVGWVPMPVAPIELSWALQAATVMNDFGHSPIPFPDLNLSIP